ncbi:MAG TPA: Rnase Y domain-containing protein, partial [Clostridia bacterium]|nr:Rnase Y domain-containing protein [Clostridia bacterium]
MYYVLAAIGGAVLALAIYILIRHLTLKGRADAIIETAKLEGEKVKQQKILQAKERFIRLKSEHESYISEKNAKMQEQENKLRQRESQLSQQAADLGRKQHELEGSEARLNARIEAIGRKEAECDRLAAQMNKQLETVAGMSVQEARNLLMDNMKAEARSEAQAYINDTIDEARLSAAKEAKRIVINTIQRTASETAIENAVTTFPIENAEIKGRIIGREGRNIRALEASTGVEIVVDDTPDAILISGF